MNALELAMIEVASVNNAYGAVLCDFEGEAVCVALGTASLSASAQVEARRHIPQSIGLGNSAGEYLLRLVAAEPCALLAELSRKADQVGVGQLTSFELRFEHVDVLVERYPEDYYLVAVLRRPTVTALARRAMYRVRDRILQEIG